MRMNLAVYAKFTNLPGEYRILCTSQIQNNNHILLHLSLLLTGQIISNIFILLIFL